MATAPARALAAVRGVARGCANAAALAPVRRVARGRTNAAALARARGNANAAAVLARALEKAALAPARGNAVAALASSFGLALTLGLALASSAGAAPIGDALDRPAIMARDATRAVLLGAAQTGDRLVAVGERGIVLLSDDAAGHWRQAPVPVSVGLTAVRFTGSHGIAVGHGGVVLTSDDAGSTWTRRLDGRQAAQLALAAAQAGSSDPAALKAARQLVSDGPDKPFLDVLAVDARRALVVGAYGLALATEDGGRTWASWMPRLDNPKGLHLYSVRARGEHLVIAGEQGLVLRSDDGGRSFTRLTTPYKGSFFTCELPADDEIVVAGLRGNVWRSTDRGLGWLQLPVPMPASVTGSALRTDGSLLLVNQAGGVLVGRGAGAAGAAGAGAAGALLPLKTPPLPPLSAVVARADGSALALGVQGPVLLPAPLALGVQGPVLRPAPLAGATP